MRRGASWRFDTKAGEQEILNRRIGRNELNAIAVCRAYVEAQNEYAAHYRHGRPEYAQRFLSTPGRHDGLYWQVGAGEEESPLGPLLAQARAEGYEGRAHDKPRPYHGYYFRILKRQGAHAPMGAKSYVVEGHMIDGFALVAFPALYRSSGIMTFIVNQNGIVYERNLGAATARIARGLPAYDPDEGWMAAP